jgi:hypothetical protein
MLAEKRISSKVGQETIRKIRLIKIWSTGFYAIALENTPPNFALWAGQQLKGSELLLFGQVSRFL